MTGDDARVLRVGMDRAFEQLRGFDAVAGRETWYVGSRDGGLTWDVEQEGLHASYCSAVAFAGDDVFLSASVDHFAAQGAIYRRRVDGHDSLVVVDGLLAWTDGIIDTGCIATRGGSRVLRSEGQPLMYRPIMAVAGRGMPTACPRQAACSSSETQQKASPA